MDELEEIALRVRLTKKIFGITQKQHFFRLGALSITGFCFVVQLVFLRLNQKGFLFSFSHTKTLGGLLICGLVVVGILGYLDLRVLKNQLARSQLECMKQKWRHPFLNAMDNNPHFSLLKECQRCKHLVWLYIGPVISLLVFLVCLGL